MPTAIHTTKILDTRRMGSSAVEIRLARPRGFEFQAGQRLRIHHGNIERDYSISSAPAEPELTVLFQPFEDGAMTPWLSRLPAGAPLAVSGPYGHFLFRPSVRQPVFVATGTGIAPFRAMAASSVSGFVMLHGVRNPVDQIYRDVISTAAAEYIPCVSGMADTTADEYPGRVTAYLDAHIPTVPCDFYLCGRQDMIRDVIHRIDRSCPGSHIFTEAFY